MADGMYDGNGSRSPQWWPSRYGADDEIGTGNELTPDRTLSALQLPKEGRVIQIAQTLTSGAPAYPPREFHQLVLVHNTLQSISESQMSGMEEHVTTGLHMGCHVDGLGHVGVDGRFYNGRHFRDFYNPSGLQKMGIETVRPWVGRGVCLDIAGLEGEAVLPEGYVITPEHLESACEKQDVQVRAGDAVLLHTGWGALWMQDEKYDTAEPGAGWDACHWLTERRVSAVSADNWAFEVIPFEQPNKQYACHQHLLAETGTFIIENIKTQELVAGSHSEFLFVMAPNKIKGATASQVSPLCIV